MPPPRQPRCRHRVIWGLGDKDRGLDGGLGGFIRGLEQFSIPDDVEHRIGLSHLEELPKKDGTVKFLCIIQG